LQLLDKSSNTLNGVESTALKNAKSYFVACMNITAKETQSTKPLLEVSKLMVSYCVPYMNMTAEETRSSIYNYWTKYTSYTSKVFHNWWTNAIQLVAEIT